MNRFAVLVGTLIVATLAAPAINPQLMLRAAPAPVGNANDGKLFWQAQMCQYCHGVQAEGAWGPGPGGPQYQRGRLTSCEMRQGLSA